MPSSHTSTDNPDKLITGYLRRLFDTQSRDLPKAVVDLCVKYRTIPVFHNATDDPVNFVSDQDKKASDRYKQRGNQYYANKKYEQAIIKYNTALQFNPNNHLLFCNRAHCHYLLQDYPRAFLDIKHCISIEPASCKGWYRYGLVLEKLERLDKAGIAYYLACELSRYDIEFGDDSQSLSVREEIKNQCDSEKARYMNFVMDELQQNSDRNMLEVMLYQNNFWEEPQHLRFHESMVLQDRIRDALRAEGVPEQSLKSEMTKHPAYYEMAENMKFVFHAQRSRYMLDCAQDWFRSLEFMERAGAGIIGKINRNYDWKTWHVEATPNDTFQGNKRRFFVTIRSGTRAAGEMYVYGRPTALQVVKLLWQTMTYSHLEPGPPMRRVRPANVVVPAKMKNLLPEMQRLMRRFGVDCFCKKKRGKRGRRKKRK